MRSRLLYSQKRCAGCLRFDSSHQFASSLRMSNVVYALFDREGVLNLLDSDYDDLHGMSMEYLLHFLDEYLEGAADRECAGG